jgi:hypothetical protein
LNSGSEISRNVASAAEGTGHVVFSSAEVVRDASEAVDLRLKVENFLARVAV